MRDSRSDRPAATVGLRPATSWSIAGYLMNLGLLTILVDRFGVAHQIAQLVALVAIVPTMFMLLRYSVFKPA